jgi:hypothetical protein
MQYAEYEKKYAKKYAEYAKKYVKKYANPFSICRILTGLYSAYFAYIYTPHFADGIELLLVNLAQLSASMISCRLLTSSTSPSKLCNVHGEWVFEGLGLQVGVCQWMMSSDDDWNVKDVTAKY